MATSGVSFNGNMVMDISDTTATANKVYEGFNFYGADGVKYTGTAGIFPINPSPIPSTPGAIWIETS